MLLQCVALCFMFGHYYYLKCILKCIVSNLCQCVALNVAPSHSRGCWLTLELHFYHMHSQEMLLKCWSYFFFTECISLCIIHYFIISKAPVSLLVKFWDTDVKFTHFLYLTLEKIIFLYVRLFLYLIWILRLRMDADFLTYKAKCFWDLRLMSGIQVD